MPMNYGDMRVASPDIVGQRFGRGLRTGIDLGSNAALVELRRQVESEMADKRSILERAKGEKEDSDAWGALSGRIASLTPEEQARFANFPKTKAGAEQASGELERILKGKDTSAADEKTAAKTKAEAKTAFEAQKRRLTAKEKEQFAQWLDITDPSAEDVKAFAAEISDFRKSANEKPDKPNETETRIALVKKATELGKGDPYRGWQIIKEQDPATYFEAEQRGIKVEREDKASPKAEKLLEDVQGEWQYEKDRYVEALGKAQKDRRVIDGDMTPEQVVAEAGLADPGPINLYAFKYLSDRKDFLNEDAVNEAFHRLNKEAGRDRTGRGMLPMPAEGKRPTDVGPTGTRAGSGQVPASQAAALEEKLNRADAILEKLEEEMGLKK